MTEELITTFINTSVLLILLIFQILTPKLVRKNILFGVTVPEDKLDDDKIIEMHKNFKKDNIFLGIPMLIIFCYLFYTFSNPRMEIILKYSNLALTY